VSETNRSIILVVDDDPRDRELFRLILKRAGHEVLEADSGRQALQTLMTTRVDLTILDLSMPEMDGLEVLQATKYMAKPKILVVTGLSSAFGDTMLETASKLGATATLDKQHAVDLLLPMVGDLLTDR